MNFTAPSQKWATFSLPDFPLVLWSSKLYSWGMTGMKKFSKLSLELCSRDNCLKFILPSLIQTILTQELPPQRHLVAMWEHIQQYRIKQKGKEFSRAWEQNPACTLQTSEAAKGGKDFNELWTSDSFQHYENKVVIPSTVPITAKSIQHWTKNL